VHRTSGENVWRRTSRGSELSATGSFPTVPDGQAAPAETGSIGPVTAAGALQADPSTVLSSGPAQAHAQPTPIAESDWMAVARQEAERARHQDASPSLVRPYARTGGRTKPVRDLDLEALVRTTLSGKEASTSPWLTPEHTTIIELCSGTVSVAEIAARLAVPLGVARVIIADMVDLGLVEVMKTSAAEGDERDPDFLRRVLSGLQRL
jgi:hypothetical protein